DEARRARDDVREEFTVDESDRQTIGRAVREAADCQPLRIDGAARERILEGAIEEVDVRTERPSNRVPRASPRIGGQYDDAELVGNGEERGHAPGVATSAMQHHGKRRR